MRKAIGHRKCTNCNADVEIFHRKRMEQEFVFCNRECAKEWKIRTNLNCKCAVCGKMFHRNPSQIARAVQPLTCSRACLGELRALLYKGESNPNYENKGEKNPLFKGEITEHAKYLWEYAPEHPFCPKGASNRVRKHRLVAEQYLLTDENSLEIDGKRYLKPEYDVHHIDGDKYNNEPNNLMVLTRAEHQALHQKLKRLKSTGA